MKKICLFSLLLIASNAIAATPWWEQPTVCRLNPSGCYATMGTGYDSGMWDAGANCWGMKVICGDALKNTNQTTPVGKTEIARGTNINPDYDINILNGDCFGVRRSSSDGTMASVDGSYVRVWCAGILQNSDETVDNGEITYGTQPTCATLATDGYIAIQNGKCFGKYYDPSQYFIQCNGENPSLIVLNGAPMGDTSYPLTQSDADAIFNRMYENVHRN